MVPIGKQNIKIQRGRKAHDLALFRPALNSNAAITDMTQRRIGMAQRVRVRITASSGGDMIAVATVNIMAGIAQVAARQYKPFLAGRVVSCSGRSG